MGLTTTAFIVSIQSTVAWNKRGVATATNMFMRNVGSTIGAALLGGILNSRLLSYLSSKGVDEELSLDSATTLLESSERSGLTAESRGLLQQGLEFALHDVYLVVFGFALLSFVLILFLPKNEKAESK
ncbi:hypothetical protein [Bacillus sp. SA1-12]|uniref:hypothetical protein n=1 Tax=Bacillus sp. SA1-12 TaxID=1455638 RepID=UPI000AD10436